MGKLLLELVETRGISSVLCCKIVVRGLESGTQIVVVGFEFLHRLNENRSDAFVGKVFVAVLVCADDCGGVLFRHPAR